MANAYYCAPATVADQDITQADRDRATALGCQMMRGDPSGTIVSYPSVVVVGNHSTPVVLPDDIGQAIASDVSAALAAATKAETDYAAYLATAGSNISTLIAGLAAQLTQAQTDITALSTSTDPLAPVLTRVIQAVLALTQGLASIGALNGHIDPSEIPKI